MSNKGEASSQHKTDNVSSSPRQERLKELLNPQWLRAYNRSANVAKISLKQKDVISLSDSSRPFSQAKDVGSFYHAGDIGGILDGNDDDRNDLFKYLDPYGA